jgi:CelD/BcsL family acetyltransferase involved in cellulose biosynthesis
MTLYATVVVRDEQSLTDLAPAWEALWNRASGATPFQSPRWLIPWWRAFAPGELFTVTVWRGSRLIGLAPLFLESGPLGLRLLPLGISLSDYLDVLIDPEWFEPAAQALVRRIVGEAGTWQVCELSDLAPDADALRLPGFPDCEDAVTGFQSCPVLALPDSTARLQSTVPRRKARNSRMSRNRASRRGEIKFLQAAPETVQGALSELIRLHQARWESQGESGLFADPRVEAFHRNAIAPMLDAGLARLYVLDVGGTTVAVYYGFLHRGRALAYMVGLDPDWAFESLGTILIWHAMEEAIREGAREFDFLRGREPYKYGWGATDRWSRCRTFRRVEAYADAF